MIVVVHQSYYSPITIKATFSIARKFGRPLHIGNEAFLQWKENVPRRSHGLTNSQQMILCIGIHIFSRIYEHWKKLRRAAEHDMSPFMVSQSTLMSHAARCTLVRRSLNLFPAGPLIGPGIESLFFKLRTLDGSRLVIKEVFEARKAGVSFFGLVVMHKDRMVGDNVANDGTFKARCNGAKVILKVVR